MEVLPGIALMLGAVGAILGVYATLRGQNTTSKESQLTLAWQMQEKQLDMLIAENKDLRDRVTACDAEMAKQRDDLRQCFEVRRLLEIQVEVLKQRGR